MLQKLHHKDTEAQRNSLSALVIGAAIKVYRQPALPVKYKGLDLDVNHRIDLLVPVL